MTPEETFYSGLAVCEGYARLFAELATLGGVPSSHVRVVSGFGKGYGFRELKEGDPIPDFQCGHAWNAIYLQEYSRWHLIDGCWGAGHVTGLPNPAYHKRFNPSMFTQMPGEFIKRHFPKESENQFFEDGTEVGWVDFVTWELREGKKPVTFTAMEELGFEKSTIEPGDWKIGDEYVRERDGRVRFAVGKTCPHQIINLREEYVYIITIDGVREQFPLEPPRPGGDGEWDAVTWSVTIDFWNDPELRGVRMDGRKVMLAYVKEIAGENARGVGVAGYLQARGRKGMSWGGLAKWNED
ncbi:hypothetical protein BDZ91DRAFT_719107 [Kalaharituber pfeilii]|nr:hypothetical protein BDZ91DRAFT_719107 [Kalaharituber pfeilii]